MKKHIISIGGGGFQNEHAPALDKYMLGLCSRKKPRVCCIATASGELPDYLTRFYSTFTQYECSPFHLSFFRSPISDYRSLLADCDLAYVMGGNTRAMLAIWREWALHRILRERYEQGMVLAGNSAGAICWFDQGHTDSNGPILSPLNGLGFLSGSCSPHYNGEPHRRPSFLKFISDGTLAEGYGIEDGAALHFVNEALHQVIAWRDGKKAYRVTRDGNQAVEEELSAIKIYK
jgi:dipeptidase E